MIYIKQPDLFHNKFYSIKYSTNPYSKSEIIDLQNDDYKEIFEDELKGKKMLLLSIDSFDMFPLEILRYCKIVYLDIYAHFEMNDENFKILNNIHKCGTVELQHRTGYQEWIRAKLRLEIIKNILE